jgi:hypothetical protein
LRFCASAAVTPNTRMIRRTDTRVRIHESFPEEMVCAAF